ncbi:Tyrosine recombinase XerC [termite gut metagenome]|uniref:Tyrosine recombinase XerC n=1 Tax=termite gut metagenome TaxID=433724 RepID=A0A5J4SS47_9ZZZZ
MKTQVKSKEPIKVRVKKLANGNSSIYLDIYTDGKRTYEFLKLYLVPEKTKSDKTTNANTLQLANAIKAKRIVELQNNEHGFSNTALKSKVKLFDYIQKISEEYFQKLLKEKQPSINGKVKGTHQKLNALLRHLKQYAGDKIILKQVDKEYIKGFIAYLKTAKNSLYREYERGTNCSKYLSQNTQHGYYLDLALCINRAYRDGLISVNPLRQLQPGDIPKKQEGVREYLTIDEVKALVNTECVRSTVKQAFLFACFTGLRFSDVKALTWGDFHTDNEGDTFIQYRQLKTQKQEYLQVSKEAIKFMPERGEASDNEKVFLVATNGHINLALKAWVMSAGITKNVTFHVSRHTNATLLLSLGVPIETVSKLLGHSEIKTTQIYAKVIDKNKKEAVNKLNGITD